MRKAVTAIFTAQDKIFTIKRQDYLPTFPGYTAFPGGKVDKDEKTVPFEGDFFKKFQPELIHALVRELKEEINYDLEKGIETGQVLGVHQIGNAVTPEFNPYRFDTYFFKIELKIPVDFVVDEGEAQNYGWESSKDLLEHFENGEILAVPPTIQFIQALGKNINRTEEVSLEFHWDPDSMVPMIEPVKGIKQFLPLSNTFPPANRTNCFLIGDTDGFGVLIDPSPKNEKELSKLYQSISHYQIKRIFLTHHHPDHHEYSNHMARTLNLPMKMSKDTFKRIKSNCGKDYFEGIEVKIAKEGDVITSCLGQEVVLYSVPGHDEGQLALATKNMGWMIVSDLIQTVGTVLIGEPEGDMAKYFNSLERVIKLNPKVILPSHGIAMGGTYKLQETLKHRKMRESQIVELLKDNKSSIEILGIIYKDLPENLHKYALKTIDCHIKKIQAEKLT